MGLPLFVAPVKSDVARKPSQKNAATSPPRRSIRRRYERIPRHATSRAASTIYGSGQGTLPTGHHERSSPWLEAGAGIAQESMAPATSSAGRLWSTEESLDDIAHQNLMRSQRGEGRISNSRWDHVGAGPGAEEGVQDADASRRSFDARGRGRHPRMLTRISSRFTRSPDTVDSGRTQTLTQTNGPPAADGSSASGESSTRQQQQVRLAQLARRAYFRRRTQDMRRSSGVDGLGDRDRSLSPQGWDTLLTTLAPDPQAPSANTSFASGTSTTTPQAISTGTHDASQTVGQSTSSSTGNSGVGYGIIVNDAPLDAECDSGCDSGCEHSDTIEAGFQGSRWGGWSVGRRREQGRQSGGGRATEGRGQRRSDQGGAHSGASWRSGGERELMYGVSMSGTTPSEANGQDDAWVGRALVGASERESTSTDGGGLGHVTVSALSSLLSSAPGEEDLAGMQRIFRNLARREDIPDEWWAGAGLSRSLSRQGSN